MGDAGIVHIIDDDSAIRNSLGLLLASKGFDVKTHASARGFLDAIGPDDNVMTEISDFDSLVRMEEPHAAPPVIVITSHADVPLGFQAMKERVTGVFKKPFCEDALIAALRRALAHKRGEQPRCVETEAILARRATLTSREKEVLAALVEGHPNKVIAHELGISVRTVEVHRAHVMTKMRARSLSELVRMSMVIS